MKNNMIVLFDLERTVIDTWDNRQLITNNIKKIKTLLSQLELNDFKCTFGVYSYAIWCINNLKILKSEIIPRLEKSLKIKFDDSYIFHMDDIMNDFAKKHTGIDYRAYCYAISKEMSIMDFQKDNLKFLKADITLIDNNVTHAMTIFIPEAEAIKTITFINPEKLN